MSKLLDVKIKIWHEREKFPRASAKKTSLKEFYFDWKKKNRWYRKW